MKLIQLYTIVMVSFFFSATASAQVFESGPSDSTLFTTVFNLPGDALPGSVGGIDGETTQLNVASGGSISNAFDINSGVELNINGGSLGRCSQANSDSETNISDGSIGDEFFIIGQVNVSGGTVGDRANILGELNLSGGSLGNEVNVSSGAINISGGTVGNEFTASPSGEVNLFGSDFVLDGAPINGLVVGEAFPVTDRDVTLSGVLDDGTPFSFNLNIANIESEDRFAAAATLTVTLTSATDSVLVGDVNQDNFVNFLDISPFIAVLSANGVQAEADVNGDGSVDFSDIAPFIALLSS